MAERIIDVKYDYQHIPILASCVDNDVSGEKIYTRRILCKDCTGVNHDGYCRYHDKYTLLDAPACELVIVLW